MPMFVSTEGKREPKGAKMDKEKQIDEMLEAMNESCGSCFGPGEAECIYNAGYRKASEVAREIFEEIEREINDALQSNYKVLPLIEQSEALWNRENGKIDALRGIEGYIAELKKKYTER